MKRRGRIETLTDGMRVLVTVHASAVLRSGDEDDGEKARADFVKDLRALARHVSRVS